LAAPQAAAVSAPNFLAAIISRSPKAQSNLFRVIFLTKPLTPSYIASEMDHSRDPCPWVTLSDFGGAFCMGAIGGSLWHGIKGFRNSPYGERRIGMITAIKARAPVTGGNFGVWGGMVSRNGTPVATSLNHGVVQHV
jgi:hypothetical protein